DAERAAFSSPDIAKASSGAALGKLANQALELTLKPVAEVKFAVPPGGKPETGTAPTYGGILNFEAPAKPGLYQVTLSSGGWIDMLQGGKALPAAGHTGAKDCQGVRKSVRFTLQAAPVIVQISGVYSNSIKVAVRPAE